MLELSDGIGIGVVVLRQIEEFNELDFLLVNFLLQFCTVGSFDVYFSFQLVKFNIEVFELFHGFDELRFGGFVQFGFFHVGLLQLEVLFFDGVEIGQ